MPDTTAPPAEWGWVRYERTRWIREAEGGGKPIRCFIGHFRQQHDPLHYTDMSVRFWARRPVLAMKQLALGGDPASAMDTVVN